MNYELRKYSFGETLGKGINLYLDNFIPIVLVSIICDIPTVILTINTSRPEVTLDASYFIKLFLNMGISIVIGAILSGFIIHLVSKKFLETIPDSPKSVSISFLPLILPVIGLSIIMGIIVLLGFILLFIPGIILALGFSIATQVLVIEKRNIFESIKRSWDLTKGKKSELFAIYVVSSLIVYVPLIILVAILAFLLKELEILTYLNALISALIMPVIPCILVVVYFNLRIEKEGFNIEHLAQQFTLADSAGPPVES
jgi:hypothetical protein